jgi:hypothetical protein
MQFSRGSKKSIYFCIAEINGWHEFSFHHVPMLHANFITTQKSFFITMTKSHVLKARIHSVPTELFQLQ